MVMRSGYSLEKTGRHHGRAVWKCCGDLGRSVLDLEGHQYRNRRQHQELREDSLPSGLFQCIALEAVVLFSSNLDDVQASGSGSGEPQGEGTTC